MVGSSTYATNWKVRIIVMGLEGAIKRSNFPKGDEQALLELVSLVKQLPAEKLISAIWDGVCLPQPVWTPRSSVTIDGSGAPTATESGVTGIFSVQPYQAFRARRRDR